MCVCELAAQKVKSAYYCWINRINTQTEEKQSKVKEVYVDSQFKGTVPHAGDVPASGLEAAVYVVSAGRKQRVMHACIQPTFSFLYSPPPSPENDATHFSVQSSHLNKPNQDNPSQVGQQLIKFK